MNKILNYRFAKKLKTVFSLVAILIIELNYLLIPSAFAQEISGSAQTPTTASPTANVTNAPTFVPTNAPHPTIAPPAPSASLESSASGIIFPALPDNIQSTISSLLITPISSPTPGITLIPSVTFSPSATIKQPVQVRALAKQSFRANEAVTVIVDNAWTKDVKLDLFDVDGRKQDISLETVSDGEPAVIKLTPSAKFRAGRYRLKITDQEGKVTTQDFTWGVLAINTNKSIYQPNETAKLAFSVLDETGMMVCDAKINLEIKNPNSEIQNLTTEEGTIKVNPECKDKKFTLNPDYEANYKTQETGVYNMKLTAETPNGKYTITDAFEARENVPFEVDRVTATRIFPPETYPMKFQIVFNEDFSGEIKETVPGNFAVSALAGTKEFETKRMPQTQTSSKVLGAAIFGLVLPFDNKHPVSLGFGQQLRDPLVKTKYADFGLLGHDGIDFDMPAGTPVLAIDDGVVVKAEPNGDYGTTLVIQHDWGKSYYGHLSLMTAPLGSKVKKGHPVALSGNTGLTTNAHLHFGIKPNNNDIDNGYYGKINPWPYLAKAEDVSTLLAAETEADSGNKTPSQTLAENPDDTFQVLTWQVAVKKGEKIELGYSFQAPNISPQFYLLGPLTFNKGKSLAFAETRQWQLAIDANGSGTNTVIPTTGTTDATGQTYTFTFTPAESMGSGGFTISVPSGWSQPQGTAETAGYTTAVGNTAAVVGKVEDTMDSATGWSAGTACSGVGGLSADTTTKQEGSASIKCVNGDEIVGDVWYKNISSEDWSGYTKIGFWARASSTNLSVTGRINFSYDDSSNLASTLEDLTFTITAANTWEYKVLTFGSTTRTGVVSYGFKITHGTKADGVTIWSDYLLLGPGKPTFSGSGPWTIDVPLVLGTSTDTITVTYGSGGGTSGVKNSSSAGVHTFTTQSRISVAGTLTDISSSPTVTLSASGPTTDQQMRHGNWFNAGVEQSFTF